MKTEIPYQTFVEFVEYLDVYEAIKEHQYEEQQRKIEQAQNKNSNKTGR